MEEQNKNDELVKIAIVTKNSNDEIIQVIDHQIIQVIDGKKEIFKQANLQPIIDFLESLYFECENSLEGDNSLAELGDLNVEENQPFSVFLRQLSQLNIYLKTK